MAREEQQPMSDARLEMIVQRVNTERPWMPVGRETDNRHIAQAWNDRIVLLAEVERLRAREAALVEVVRAVATADNSDNSVCYQVCDYSMHGDWMIEHEAPCVVKQARALLASADETPQPLRAECHICRHLVTEAELVLAADGLPIGCQYCTNDAVLADVANEAKE